MVRFNKEEILDSFNIVEFIGREVILKRTGQDYKGLCPFHDEKTASFSVSPAKQSFHCFGCHRGGNIIGYLMEKKNYSFPEALEELAREAGIQPRSFSKEERKKRDEKNEIYNALYEAGVFFQNKFPGSAAEKYIKGRGIKEETIDYFGLGYAPQGWEGLVKALSPMFKGDVLEKAGLIKKRDSTPGYYDIFRNKLIFPISDKLGRTIGFAGRSIDGSLPKYMNSPETLLFKKREILFGLNSALQNIGEEKKLIVVEGYIDVVHPWQEEFKNFAATCGTALTEIHSEIIGDLEKNRFKGELETILCFDGDSAGQKSAARVIPTAIKSIDNLKICILPEDKDPDELLRDGKKSELEKILNSPKDAFGFLIDYYSPPEIETVSSKMALLNKTPIRETLFNLPSHKRGIFIDALSRKIHLSEEKVLDFLEIRQPQIRRPFIKRNFSPEEEFLREVIINYSPEVIDFLENLEITPDYFRGVGKKIFEYLIEQNGGELFNGIKTPLFERVTKRDILERLAKEKVNPKDAEKYIDNLFYKIPKKSSQRRLEVSIANLEIERSLSHERKYFKRGGSIEKFLIAKRKIQEELKI